MRNIFLAILASLCLMGRSFAYTPTGNVQEQLAKAVEYFQGGKYHEALLLFVRLDKAYKLNPRFLAYLGVCQFYERNYKETVAIFDKIMPNLQAFAPHERSVYIYCAAESHFRLHEYHKAIVLFESQSILCYDNEKGDALFRIGLCYRNIGNIPTAQEYLNEAMKYYRRYNDSSKIVYVEKELAIPYGE